MAQISDVVTVEAPEVVEQGKLTSSEEKASKRPYGGRKALDESDKRVLFQQTWDPSIRQAFKAFTDAYNASNEYQMSEAEMLEQVILSNPVFATFFDDSEYSTEYANRMKRAEQRREDYKNRKRKK